MDNKIKNNNKIYLKFNKELKKKFKWNILKMEIITMKFIDIWLIKDYASEIEVFKSKNRKTHEKKEINLGN